MRARAVRLDRDAITPAMGNRETQKLADLL